MSRQEQHGGQHEWKRYVELLLDRETPVVLYRGWGVADGQVVNGLIGKDPVLDVKGRPHHLCQEVPSSAQGREGQGRDRDDEQHEKRSRKQTPSTPSPEPSQSQATGALHLGEQVAPDQEPGDHKEDINTNEAARQPVRPQVVEQHQANCQRPKALDVRTQYALPTLHHAGTPSQPLSGTHIRAITQNQAQSLRPRARLTLTPNGAAVGAEPDAASLRVLPCRPAGPRAAHIALRPASVG